MVCRKFNDAGWVPESTIFDELHHGFSVSFSLPLYQNDGQDEKWEAKNDGWESKRDFPQ